mgnify:CR=1 FL=1
MTTSAILSIERGAVKRLTSRRGETLIEILSSILVLSIGLVGVLAAIPFGGMRMAQMTEADNSAAVGRNAVRFMNANNWSDPFTWFTSINTGTFTPFSTVDPFSGGLLLDGQNNTLDLRYPYIIDPLGDNATQIAPPQFHPYITAFQPDDDGYPVVFTHVSPLPKQFDTSLLASSPGLLVEWYQRFFYQQDDLIAGYYDAEDRSDFRPRVEIETRRLLDNTISPIEVGSYTGRYSWMAFVYPKALDSFVDLTPFSEISYSEFETVVFRDRVVDGERAFKALVSGSGYLGGTVELDLASMRNNLNNGYPTGYTAERQQILEQLEQTRYIMLVGPADESEASHLGGYINPPFAHWYKIANWTVLDKDGDGAKETVRMTLVGKNMPRLWTTTNPVVTAVFYPGAIGVYNGSTNVVDYD